MVYEYIKVVDAYQLKTEIQTSEISIALNSVSTNNDTVYVDFKAEISETEIIILNQIINDHVPSPKKSSIIEVITQYEKNDKTLKTVWAHAEANSNGIATIEIPIPEDGRYIAYGDAEFETRHIWDRITKIEVVDINNIFGMGEGVVLNSYVENELPLNYNFGGGVGMTYQYGTTEVQPVGGYGRLPGLCFLRLEATKGNGELGIGCKLSVSIDWAKSDG